jgi:porphobilinogen deaminase
MSATLRLGSRRSPIAITQSRQVADLITERTGRQWRGGPSRPSGPASG